MCHMCHSGLKTSSTSGEMLGFGCLGEMLGFGSLGSGGLGGWRFENRRMLLLEVGKCSVHCFVVRVALSIDQGSL